MDSHSITGSLCWSLAEHGWGHQANFLRTIILLVFRSTETLVSYLSNITLVFHWCHYRWSGAITVNDTQGVTNTWAEPEIDALMQDCSISVTFAMEILHACTEYFRNHRRGFNGSHHLCTWASYQIRKIAVCACAGNAGNVFRTKHQK